MIGFLSFSLAEQTSVETEKAAGKGRPFQSEWRLYAFWVKGSIWDACRALHRYAPPMTMAVILGLSGVNLWTFLCFWQDKARAVGGGRRVPERDLLRLALIGGSPAAFAACYLLRHKTRKQPFRGRLRGIAMVQAVLLLCWIGLA